MTTAADAAVHRWDDLDSDRPMELLSRRRITGVHAMLSEIHLDQGCHVPTHAHENEQFACVISGRMRFGLGAEDGPDRREVTLGPGEVLHVPPLVPHSADALEDSVVLDVFSPPSEKTGVDAHG
ncbi:MAG: cupin domain-containing protein [Planctomycetota bacterium]|jgi:quercetin dioxygenase-like cupin family protein